MKYCTESSGSCAAVAVMITRGRGRRGRTGAGGADGGTAALVVLLVVLRSCHFQEMPQTRH